LAIDYLMHFLVLSYPEEFYTLGFRHVAMMYAIATLLMWGLRVLVKTLYELTTLDARAIRVLIYGEMEGGVGLAKLIRSQSPARFNVKGFIAPDGKYNSHNRVMGLRVYNSTDDIAQIAKHLHVEAVLVAAPRKEEFRNDQKLQDQLLGAGIKIFMSESAKEVDVKDGELQDNQQDDGLHLKEVSVEDLLPRDEIRVDMKSVGELLTGRRVMITGAAGSIGSEMVRQIAAYQPEAMMLIDQAETPDHDLMLMMQKRFPKVQSEVVVTSICKQDRMEAIFKEFRPDYVFHAAAYKHVPMMEGNPSEAVQNNVYGTKVIADLSVKYGVKKFVMVSTDKAVNPTNVMGCSKRICEIYVQALDKTCQTQFVTTRFGNVLGSNGSVIPLFKKQIRNGGPVTVTDENIVRYFMLIPEACKLVLEAGTKGNGGEIFVFDMGKPVRIADLAKRMIKLSGAKNVEIKYTGLRPGEKLYEEVLNDKEGTKPTFHEKIRIAEVRSYEFAEVSKDIDELIEISKGYDNMATVKKMKEIVPEYKSNNSVYEELDNK
jgi:FlaA1/EpsC-like NDP-sugar epimerase